MKVFRFYPELKSGQFHERGRQGPPSSHRPQQTHVFRYRCNKNSIICAKTLHAPHYEVGHVAFCIVECTFCNTTFGTVKYCVDNNKIEIQGITGAVKVSSVGDTRIARFSVCTETTYNGAGGIVVDCAWFNVTCWQSDKITCLDQLGKGKIVRVLGRVRVQRYTDEAGAERSCWEVLAHKLEIMED